MFLYIVLPRKAAKRRSVSNHCLEAGCDHGWCVTQSALADWPTSNGLWPGFSEAAMMSSITYYLNVLAFIEQHQGMLAIINCNWPYQFAVFNGKLAIFNHNLKMNSCDFLQTVIHVLPISHLARCFTTVQCSNIIMNHAPSYDDYQPLVNHPSNINFHLGRYQEST